MKKLTKKCDFIFSNLFINYLIVTVLIVSLSIGCKKETAPAQTNVDAQSQSDDLSIEKWGKPDIVVHKGQSIQAAVDKAKDGMTILIEPGTYEEAITVSKPGIKLVGKFSLRGGEVII